MYITVTIEMKGKAYHIQADENLPIRNAEKALLESFYDESYKPSVFLKSVLQCKLISSYFTFSQAEIQTGDILLAIE